MFSQIKKGLFRLNWHVIANMLGNVLWVEGLLMLLPLFVTFIYQDGGTLAFALTIAIALLIGIPLSRIKTILSAYFAKDGMSAVGLSWIAVSMVGALPFSFSGEIPSYIDAFFETVSGFTTTGASILKDVTALSNGMLFWRSFTHYIGGIGVLVFVVALIPDVSGRTIYILRAEMPGPTVGKLLPRVKSTAKILYLIYIFLSALQVAFLLFGGMRLYESLIHSFGTAGTGGFSNKNASIAAYNSRYFEYVITVFMLLFSVNFNLVYLMVVRDFKNVWKNEDFNSAIGKQMKYKKKGIEKSIHNVLHTVSKCYCEETTERLRILNEQKSEVTSQIEACQNYTKELTEENIHKVCNRFAKYLMESKDVEVKKYLRSTVKEILVGNDDVQISLNII